MKVKADFVTNSSSTSFIVFSDRPIQSQDWEYLVKTKKVAKRLDQDFKNIPPTEVDGSRQVLDLITDTLVGGTIIGLPYNLPRDERKNLDKMREINTTTKDNELRIEKLFKVINEVEKKHRIECRKLAKKIIDKHFGKTFYIVSYSSDTGDHIAATIRCHGNHIFCNNVFISAIEIDNS